jgi:lipoprotein-releasing system ATP-binding protein
MSGAENITSAYGLQSEKHASASIPLIEVHQLYKSFWLEERCIEVLCGVDLTLSIETVAIIGASGAGKSTLLHLLGTLDTPTSGQISILGRDVLALDEDELAAFRNQYIGFVFQAHYLLPEFSALENVMMPAFIQRLPRREAEDKARELLDWVGLYERLHHRPGELSGGERQRVALCRALVMRPRILLADEPTGNLDDRTAKGIHELIHELHERWKITPIVVTHNLSLAQQMERQFVLSNGQMYQHNHIPVADLSNAV